MLVTRQLMPRYAAAAAAAAELPLLPHYMPLITAHCRRCRHCYVFHYAADVDYLHFTPFSFSTLY